MSPSCHQYLRCPLNNTICKHATRRWQYYWYQFIIIVYCVTSKTVSQWVSHSLYYLMCNLAATHTDRKLRIDSCVYGVVWILWNLLGGSGTASCRCSSRGYSHHDGGTHGHSWTACLTLIWLISKGESWSIQSASYQCCTLFGWIVQLPNGWICRCVPYTLHSARVWTQFRWCESVSQTNKGIRMFCWVLQGHRLVWILRVRIFVSALCVCCSIRVVTISAGDWQRRNLTYF